VELEKLIEAIGERFKGSNLELNIKLAKAGFDFGRKL